MGRRKKKYADYKATGRKLAPLHYLFDRTAPVMIVAAVAVAGVGVYNVVGTGYKSLEDMNKPVVDDSPYLSLASANSVGRDWASSLIKVKPEGVKSWTVSDTSKADHPIDSKLCASLTKLPTSLLATYVGNGGGVETRVQLYGAGQSAKNFNAYATAIGDCFVVSTATVDGTSVIKFNNTFLLNIGDSIISVTAKDPAQRDSLLKFYLEKASETLRASKCVALQVEPNDSKRSFYYDSKNYEGLKESKKVSTKVNIVGFPTPRSTKVLDIKGSLMEKPESPLPVGFPEMPKSVDRPNVPSPVETQTAFNGTAVYQVADENGPGCGWGWSGQEAPVYDNAALKKDEKARIQDMQDSVDSKAQSYVDGKLNWSLNVALLAPTIDNWNKYVKNVDKVQDKWSWLNNERAKIQPLWETYVANHDLWLTFDERKLEATENYNEALKQCKTQQDELDKWNKEWGDLYKEQEKQKAEEAKRKAEEAKKKAEEEKRKKEESNSPRPTDSSNPTSTPVASDDTTASAPATGSPTETSKPMVDIPPKPEGCDKIPTKPVIMDQDKPKEPQAPSVPEDVTIPDSWPKPKSN